MKNLLIIALALLNFNAFGQKKTDWEELGLKGKVKILRENSYNVVEKDGIIQRDESHIDSLMYLFNKQGNMQEQKYDTPILYKYDDKGDVIERCFYDQEGSVDRKDIYKYDKKGNLIEIDTDNMEGGLHNKRIYKYDNRGNMTYLYYNFPSDFMTYRYDDKGNMIEEREYLFSKIRYKFVNKYDDKGNRIERYEYSPEGRLKWKTSYRYDDNNNLIEERDYDPKKLIKTITYQYDEKSNVIGEKVYGSNGNLRYKYTYQYEYDERGNWLKEIWYKDEKPHRIREREIEYYQN